MMTTSTSTTTRGVQGRRGQGGQVTTAFVVVLLFLSTWFVILHFHFSVDNDEFLMQDVAIRQALLLNDCLGREDPSESSEPKSPPQRIVPQPPAIPVLLPQLNPKDLIHNPDANLFTLNQEQDSDGGLLVAKGDLVYRWGWDTAPIVLEDQKLIFFTVPKVGCTVFKQLFRRMMGYEDWWVHKEPRLPHDPAHNGLRYLSHYTLEQADEMMTSADWTRAIFVRDPKERFLSAFLDKGLKKEGMYVGNHCCRDIPYRPCAIQSQTLEGFLAVTDICMDPHWSPQAFRMEDKYWPYIDFVGHLEQAAEHTQALLERLGAWEDYGATGWGESREESIFQSTSSIHHATGANDHVSEHFTKELELEVEQRYSVDYEHPKLNLTLALLLDEEAR